jgi:hypothetical protein
VERVSRLRVEKCQQSFRFPQAFDRDGKGMVFNIQIKIL